MKTFSHMKTHYNEDLTLKDIDSTVTLAGWVSAVRDLGGIIFIELRDKTGFFQVVADPQINPDVHAVFSKLKDEYVIQVTGKVSKRPPETYNPELATGEIKPDLTFVFDVSTDVAQKRVGDEKDRMESAGIEFHKKVRQGYLEIAKLEPQRVKVIDANNNIEKVFDDTKKVLDVFLKQA